MRRRGWICHFPHILKKGKSPLLFIHQRQEAVSRCGLWGFFPLSSSPSYPIYSPSLPSPFPHITPSQKNLCLFSSLQTKNQKKKEKKNPISFSGSLCLGLFSLSLQSPILSQKCLRRDPRKPLSISKPSSNGPQRSPLS